MFKESAGTPQLNLRKKLKMEDLEKRVIELEKKIEHLKYMLGKLITWLPGGLNVDHANSLLYELETGEKK